MKQANDSNTIADIRALLEKALASGGHRIDAESSSAELLQQLNIYYQELEFQNDELRRTRLELEEAQQRYHELYDNAPMGFVSFDENLTIRTVNRTFRGLVGEIRPEGLSLSRFVHPESQDALYLHVRRTMEGGEADVCDLTLLRGDEKVRVKVESNLFTTPEGRLVRSAMLDITESERNWLRLEENRRKMGTLLDLIPIGVTVADGDGNIVTSNRAAERILGVSSAEQSKRSIDGSEWTLIRRDGSIMPAAEYASVRALNEKRLVENIEMGIRKADGSVTWLLTSATVTDLADFSLVISYLDISRLVGQEDKLSRNEALLRLYLENMPEPMVVTDPDNYVVCVNDAACAMYGYSRDELLGSTPRKFNPGRAVYHELGYTDDEYNALFAGMWRAITDPAVDEWEGQVVNRRKDGSIVWAGLKIRTIRDATGAVTNYIGLPVDITAYRTSAHNSRIELYQTIASLSELRDDETGNHMRRVGAFAKVLARGMGLPARMCDDLELFAPMHDIGKVGIPDSLLLAPRRLTAEEFEQMKKHTELGYAILADKPELTMAAEITRDHHEWWNGSGYPRGLAGETIPVAARIVALTDVYDALRSHRPYKEPWTHEEACREIMGKSGTQFDPAVTAVFLELSSAFESIFRELED